MSLQSDYPKFPNSVGNFQWSERAGIDLVGHRKRLLAGRDRLH